MSAGVPAAKKKKAILVRSKERRGEAKENMFLGKKQGKGWLENEDIEKGGGRKLPCCGR